MQNSNQYWQNIYAQGENVWGERPDSILLDYESLAPHGKVLDLGVGEGRNALYLATKNYEVTGVDLSEIAVERCRERAKTLQVPLHVEVGNLLDFEIVPNTYALIISTLTLHFLKRSEAHSVLERAKQGLQAGGLLYFTVFSTDDQGYVMCKQANHPTMIEENTFAREGGRGYAHYFEQAEILSQLADLRLIYMAQGQAYDPGHVGVPEPHYHSFIDYMGQKT